MKKFSSLLFPFLLLSIGESRDGYLKNFNPDSLRYKIIYASRCSQPPVIDGILNDESWNSANPIGEFFQIEPIEFGAPSEKTLVRVLYDDQALYVAFENLDSAPEKIRKPLTRRDAYMDGFASSADFV